ncbi:MAG: ComF family protein [Chloroflexi bacterium]|nr:ComF family protein [Chloroflexota bacterium]
MTAVLATARSAWQGALDLLFPQRCVGCRVEGFFLCPACLATARRLEPPYCAVCCEPTAGAERCGHCARAPLAVDAVRSVFAYDGVVKEGVRQFKYHNLKALAPLFGQELARLAEKHFPGVDVVLPVPMHPGRVRERGYNQAALLGGGVSRLLRAPMEERALRRVRATSPQATSSTREERQRNVQSAFAVVGALPGARVLLVDDVCTTGSTLSECALVLKEAGCASVFAVTVAREV